MQHSCRTGVWSLHITACSLLTSLWRVQGLFGQGPDFHRQAAQARLCRGKVEGIAPEVFRTPSRIGGPLRNICVANAYRLVSINNFVLPSAPDLTMAIMAGVSREAVDAHSARHTWSNPVFYGSMMVILYVLF